MGHRFVILTLSLWLCAGHARGQRASDAPAAFPAPVEQMRQHEGQRVVGSPSLECDTPLCDASARRPVLEGLVGIESGDLLDLRAVNEAYDRLSRTGYFQSVTPKVSAADEGITLVFQCVGHVIITDLDVTYTGSGSFYPQLFVSEIRKRLPYRRGGQFPPANPDGSPSEIARRQFEVYSARVANLYSQQGYEGTKVEILPEYHGPGYKRVRVLVRVTEGRQPEIGQVIVRGASAFEYGRILAALSTGEHVDLFRDWWGIFGVARYDRRELKTDLAKVEADYRDSGYVRARVRLDQVLVRENGQVYPRIRIFEGPHLETRFKGNRRLSDEALRAVLTFKESGSFDATELEASRQAIIAAYHAIAHYYVEVEPVYTRLADRAHRVTFEIKEGQRVYIRRVELSGNKRIVTADILGKMDSKGIADDGVIWGFSTSAGVVQPAQIINDLLAIRQLYTSRGMTKMNFICGEEGTSIDGWETRSKNPARDHCYEVKRDADPRLVTLKIRLEEGPQTLVDSLDFSDRFLGRLDEDTRDQANALFRNLGFRNARNQWISTGLNRRKISAVRAFVLSCLNRDGYLSPSVTPVCPLPDDPRTECSDERLVGHRFPKIVFQIDRGTQTRAQGVLLRGLLRTDPEVLEDELLFADGDPLGSDEIFNSQASIRSLRIFDTVNLQLINRGPLKDVEKADGAAVVVTVEESNAVSLDLSAGLSLELDESEDSSNVIIDTALDLKDKNFLGRALQVGVKAEYANAPGHFFSNDEYDQATTEITLPYLVDPRLFGSRVAWDLSLNLDQKLTGQRASFIRKWGVETKFSYDFFNLSRPAEWGRGLSALLGLEYGYQKERPVRSDGSRASYSEYKHSVTLSMPVTWERRDNPIHPTRGFWLEMRPELVFVRPELFSSDDSARLLPKKLVLSGQWVRSFFDKRLVLVPFLRFGAAFIDDEDDEPKPDFFFKAGGDGVTHSIRGYDDASVEACNGEDAATGICRDVYPVGVTADDRVLDPNAIGGRALLLGSLEARFPIDMETGIWLAGYFDFGAVGEDWGAIRDALFSENEDEEEGASDQSSDLAGETQVRASVGGGIRWLIGGIIPLRLDAAYPLSSTVFSQQGWRFHFNIGYPL